MPMNVAQLMVNIGANPAGAVAGIEQVSGMMGAGGMLPMAALATGAIMVGVGVAATKMAADFQSGLTSLVTGAGESQKNLGMVHDGILQMSAETGTSTKQLIAGLYMIESGGYHGAAGLAILKAAAEGAKVGTADLGVVADATDTILKNYPGVINGASGAVNTLISTVAHGKTHMEDLAGSLSEVLPTAAAASIGLNDVMGAMATMTGEGVPAAQAATFLRQTIIALMAPGHQAKKTLEEIGLTSTQVADAMHKSLPAALQLIHDHLVKKFPEGSAAYVAAMREIAGGSKQMQGMLDLGGHHLATFAENARTVAGAAKNGGKEITGWALVQQTANQQFDRAKESIGAVFITIGEKLLPVVTTIAKWFADHLPGAIKTFQTSVGPVIKVIGDLIGKITGNKQLMDALKESFERLKPAIGPILTILGILTVVALAPLALAIGAIVALFIGLMHIPEIARAVGSALGNLFGKIGEFFGGIFGKIGEFFGNVFGKIGEFFTSLPGVIDTFIGNILGKIGTFIGNVLGAIGTWRDEMAKKVGELVLGTIKKFTDLEKSVFLKIKDMVTGVLTRIKDFVTSVIQHFVDLEKRGLERIGAFKDKVISKAKELATDFIGALQGLPGKLLTLGENLIKSLAQGINNARGAVVSAVKNIPLLGGIAGGVNNMIPQFASGGTMQSNGMALVGENGPELVRMPGGSTITPLSRLPSGSAGAFSGGSGQPIVIQLHLDGRKVAQAVVPHIPGVVRNATGARSF